MPEDDKVKSPTPKSGILKGLLIIVFGFILGLEMFLFTISSYQDAYDTTAVVIGLAWFIIIFGLGLWRGITAVARRKTKRVSPVTIAVWFLLIIATLFLFLWFL